LQDALLYRFVPQDPPESVTSLKKHFEALLKGAPPDRSELWCKWFSRSRHFDDYVGYVQATVDIAARRSLIAYQTFKTYRNQGYASEACRAVFAFLATGHGVATIVAEIDSRNTASQRLVTSLGFKQISFRPKADFFKGEYSDEVVYQLDMEQARP
jgi:ribosomal-protein-alanine N-acetyltransferase